MVAEIVKLLFFTQRRFCLQLLSVETLKKPTAPCLFMRVSFKVGSAWGIPIELHFTFLLLIIAVFILSYPQFYLFSIILFLFVFVVFHELAHSVIARHYGIKVRKIILYPIGGVSEIEAIPKNPSQEWRMAIAGPLISLLLGAIFLAISLLISPQLLTSVFTAVTTGNFLFDLASLNLSLIHI